MKSKILKAFAWESLGSISGYGIDFITSIVLARLLTPEEFGIVAMALVFILIFNSLSDLGFKEALIQKKNLSEGNLSSVFYLNVLTGSLLFICFQLLAPRIGQFYGDPQVTTLLKYLSLIFIFDALSIVQVAVLSRELDFKSLNIRLMLANGIGGIIGIIAAVKGAGVFALVLQRVIASFIGLVVIWNFSKWTPKGFFAWRNVRDLVGFSVYTFLSHFTYILSKRLDILVIGKLFSANILGYFGRAESLLDVVRVLSSTSLNRVFFPVLSQIQDKKERFEFMFYRVLEVILFFSFLFSGAMIFGGELIIIGLFGPQWYDSVLIFQILMLKLFTFPINSFVISAMKAKGFAKQDFYVGLLKKFFVLISFIVAYYLGFTAFLYSVVIVSYLGVIINFFAVIYFIHIKGSVLWKEFLIFFGVFGVASILIVLLILGESVGFQIFKILIFTSIYISLIYLFKKQFIVQLYKLGLYFYKDNFPNRN